ncbi:MAG TPA: hypothetical protein VF407_21530, partial [Polyangiaceae bacterium]
PTDDAGTVDAATSHDATVDQSAPDSSGCSGGTVACGGACIDTKVDPSNCGACGKVCAKGELCSAGTCATSCGADLTECGGDAGVDLCISTKTDNANCGACGNACPSGTACTNGACELTCQSGLSACAVSVISTTPDGGAPDASADGGDAGSMGQTQMVCTDLDDDNANCGACGNACASGTVCKAGHCEVSCGAGTTLCDTDAGGKCVDEKNDNTNCGGCGVTCGAGEACSNGACSTTCGGSLTKCTTSSGSTCSDTSSDPQNCGSCGNACAAGQGCKNGSCAGYCNNKVLLLGDADSTTDATLVAGLKSYGLDVTMVANGVATYDGVTPAITGFGAIVVDGDSYGFSPPAMPTAGQQAIANAVNAGDAGLVITGGMTATPNTDATLTPFISIHNNGGIRPATVSKTVDHPIWSDVTSPINVSNSGNFNGPLGSSVAGSAVVVATTGSGPFIAYLNGTGRSVTFSYFVGGAINWQTAQPDVVHLYANAIKWSSHCDVP